jgi:deoxyribonuclease-4
MSIGIHLSKNNIEEEVTSTKSEVIQIFVSNPRGYQHPAKTVLDSIKIDIPIYIHLPYLVNFASVNEKVRKLSRDLLIATDNIIDSRVKGIVVHGGQGGRESNIEIAIKRWSDSFDGIKLNNNLLIENTAGGVAAPGKTLESLIKLIKMLRENNNIGICYDTCHAFASGASDFVIDMEKIINEIDSVDLIHLNDSKDLMGSNRDRHQLLNKGTVGRENLEKCIIFSKEKNIDVILETPGDNYLWSEEIIYYNNIF